MQKGLWEGRHVETKFAVGPPLEESSAVHAQLSTNDVSANSGTKIYNGDEGLLLDMLLFAMLSAWTVQ